MCETVDEYFRSINVAREIRDGKEFWNGEGLYNIGWSDGGYWTSNGPVWFEDVSDLAAELDAAQPEATETHLPWAELVANERFQQVDLDAYLGDYEGDFDVDEIIDRTTVIIDGNRWWKHMDEDEFAEVVRSCER